jgi:ribonucleoside-diphosphate reductase alpha chain
MNTYRWLTDLSQQFLDRDYLVDGQTVDQRVTEICEAAERYLNKPGFAAKFKEYFKKGWYSFSTPIWTNFGNDRGLPISCFGSYIDDTMESIVGTWAEVSMMTKHGGGTSAYFGKLRGRGSKIRKNGESSGSVHFSQAFDMLINIISQGKTRRGNFAGYWPIDHPDVLEALQIRTEGFPVQDLSYGVCVPDYWMEEMIGDGTATGGDNAKRRIWAKVLEARANVGFPYIMFTDTVNRNTVDCYKDRGILIHHSNLCSEIMLPNGIDESFVCDLSSMNDLYFEEWKDTDAVELLVYFLDAVMTEFIQKASKIDYMHRTVKFAERHRALGIGQIGWHSYLQSKMIPFESMEAKLLNTRIAKTIKDQAYAASAKAAREYGEPDACKGYGRRNTTLIAIAPTKSSAFIMGQASECIEPNRTNYFIKDLQKGKYTVKNQYLEQLLRAKGCDTPELWDSILKRGGSVQHLDVLDDHEKNVFKTFGEISQKEVIIQAAQRQKYIDQSQSLNLMIHPSIPTKDVNALMIEAWRLGIKSLYYQYSVNAAQAFSRNILSCASCEG